MKFVFNFIKNFLLGFLLTWYAVDLWKLFNGDMRPLWRKGINIEWLVNTKYDEKTAFVNNSQGDLRFLIPTVNQILKGRNKRQNDILHIRFYRKQDDFG